MVVSLTDKFVTQIKIANIIKNDKRSGVLKLPARFGKTITTFLISANHDINIFISTNIMLLQQAQTEYLTTYKYKNSEFKFKDKVNIQFKTKSDLLNNLIIFNSTTQYNLYIDEIHLYTGNKSLECLRFLQDLKNIRIIGLTGRIDDNTLQILNLPILYEMSEQEAVDNKYIANSIDYKVPLEFNPVEQLNYYKYTTLIKDMSKYFQNYYDNTICKNSLEFIIACAKGKRYKNQYLKPVYFCNLLTDKVGWDKDLDLNNEYLRKIYNEYHPSEIFTKANLFIKAMDLRNRLMCQNIKKAITAIKIIEKYPNDTFLIFTENTILAKEIFNNLNRNDVCLYASTIKHGTIKDDTGKNILDETGKPKLFTNSKLKKDAIAGLNSGKYRIIISPQSLETGFTEKKLTGIIILNGSMDINTQYQRENRAKTFVQNKLAKVFNVYFDDFIYNQEIIQSRDKKKLIERCEDFENLITLKINN